MLDLSTAVLCDFAQVRDRLLFVASGAVSRLYRQELPSPLGLMVGLVIEVPLEDAGMDHRLRAEVINRHGTVLATLENLFRVSDAGLFPHEVQQVPLVLSITGVRARTWGTHQVRLYLDDELVRALTLYVVPAAGPQAAPRPAPTQSRAADDEGSLGGTGTGAVAAPSEQGDEPAAPAEPAGAGTAAFSLGGDDDEAAGAPAGEEPGPTEAEGDDEAGRDPVAWGVPSDPEPEDQPATEASEPAWPAATITAEPAGGDADPEAEGPGEAEPSAEPPTEPSAPEGAAGAETDRGDDAGDGGQEGGEGDEGAPKGQSRFAFRYRYEDDES